MPYIIAAALLGLIWGSFLNVVIWRLPQMTVAGLMRRGQALSFLALPLSHCPHCAAPVPFYYNIPLLSFIWLRGRAKCCGASIGWHYPLIESAGMLICGGAAVHFASLVDALLAIAFLSVLLVAAVIDLRRYYLLDILTMPLLWLGLLANVDSRFALLEDAVLGAAGGYLFLLTLSTVMSMLLKKRAMGGGDFKLTAALGAWLGWQMLPLLLFLAAVLGLFFAGWRYLRRGRARFIPFGLTLSLAGALLLFWGHDLMIICLLFFGD